MQKNYFFSPANIALEKSTILKLWAEGFATLNGVVAEQKFQDQYLQNPAGMGQCFFIREEATGEAVGVQSLVPRQFHRGDKKIQAATMADFMVTQAHRSLGPALQLMRNCMESGATDFVFLYGFPNQKAQSIFKRAGLSPLGNITRYVKLLQSRDFLQSKIGEPWFSIASTILDAALYIADSIRYLIFKDKYDWREMTTFDVSFENLWEEQVSSGLLISERSEHLLKWRYPSSDSWKIFAAFARNSTTLLGYLVWKQQGTNITISDFLCDASALPALLHSFSWRMRKYKARRISLEFFGPQFIQNALRQAGFEARGQDPVFIFQGTLDFPLTPSSCYLTQFDRDTN